jgi:SAM-dependent methyltransferase
MAAEAMSFGQAAERYDQVRPVPPYEAMDWLMPSDGCNVAVDLAAGTGLFTRELLRWSIRVIAIEPDSGMRDVLISKARSQIQAIDGRAEQIPLPDASADAVCAHAAWHWLKPELVVPEAARVLKDGGRLGIAWTGRDPAASWLAELFPGISHDVGLPDGSPFRNIATESYLFTRTMTVPDALDWVASHSFFLTAPAADREAMLDRWRKELEARAGGGVVEIPMRSLCWRADRTGRP